MPRIKRGLADNHIYHILNRGNGGQKIFHKSFDYKAFVRLISEAKKKFPLEIFAYCLMPTHFHIVVRPAIGQHLSQWMQWLMTSHVRRYHEHYKGSGHIWQGRYKSFLIQTDHHLLTVLRYVERNPLKATITSTANKWPWSSFHENTNLVRGNLVDQWPIPKPINWIELVNTPLTLTELDDIKRSINRQRPFGNENWTKEIINKFGLESTVRPRGRPKK